MKREVLVRCLADAIEAVVRPHPTRVAVDGADAAGKTTLADELGRALCARRREVIRASSDGFHRPRAVRIRRGANSPEGYFRDSFDYAAMEMLLLAPLGPTGDRRYRSACFDCRRDVARTASPQTAGDGAILIMDGVFLQRSELQVHWDFTIWIAVSPETSLARGLARDSRTGADPQELRQRYAARYVPGHQIYLRDARPRDRADAIVHNEDLVNPRLTWGRGELLGSE